MHLSLDASECTDCPAGSYCPWGSENEPTIAPVECPTGSYNPDMKSPDKLHCMLCDQSKSCNRTGLDAPSGDCAPVSFRIFVA